MTGAVVRRRMLAAAQARVGVSEHPPGSNRGPDVDRWLLAAGVDPPEPWCGAFAYSMALAAGSAAARKVAFPASVLSWVEAADQHGWKMGRPFRADLVAYSWHGHDPHPDDHIGIVERVLALPRPRPGSPFAFKFWIRTVEGNTGDAVRRRWRWVDPRDVAFIRLPD